MKTEELLGWVVSLVFAYAFLWALLYFIRAPVIDLKEAAAALLVLAVVAKLSNPFVWKLLGLREKKGARRFRRKR